MKYLKFIFFLSLVPLPLLPYTYFVDGKVAYYIPNSSILRKITSSSWVNEQLEVNVNFFKPKLHHISPFCNITFASHNGQSLGGKEPINVYLLPFSIGLKYIISLNNRFDFYCGLGPRIFFLWTNTNSQFVENHLFNASPGGVVTGGLYCRIYNHLLLNVFFDYSIGRSTIWKNSQQNVTYNNIQLGGLSAGAGLTLKF